MAQTEFDFAPYVELWDERTRRIQHEDLYRFVENPHGQQFWPVVKAGRLNKIWSLFAKSGIIQDERGLDELCDILIDNVLRLELNTILSGHTEMEPWHYLEWIDFDEFDAWEQALSELHGDYILDDCGQWRLSDYALAPLYQDAKELFMTTRYIDRLMIADRMLQRVHCRGDIAALFVEGGLATLTELFEQKVA